MSGQAAADSPFVSYPPDAARHSPDPEYVLIKGDEDFVESNSKSPEDWMDMSSEPISDQC